MGKHSIESQINEFLEHWDCRQMTSFLKDIIPLFELYNVDEENDWVQEAVGSEDVNNVRLIKTVYLVSRIAEFHAGKLAGLRSRFPDLWLKMEGSQN